MRKILKSIFALFSVAMISGCVMTTSSSSMISNRDSSSIQESSHIVSEITFEEFEYYMNKDYIKDPYNSVELRISTTDSDEITLRQSSKYGKNILGEFVDTGGVGLNARVYYVYINELSSFFEKNLDQNTEIKYYKSFDTIELFKHMELKDDSIEYIEEVRYVFDTTYGLIQKRLYTSINKISGKEYVTQGVEELIYSEEILPNVPVPDSDKIEVVFWHTMNSMSQEYLNAFIKTFEEENPDIKVTHAAQGGYTDIESKILKAIPAKTTPTMAFCYPDHVANYIKSGSAVKLNDYISNAEYGLTAEELKDYQDAGFWSEGSESYGKDGSVYSVPFSKSTEVLFMNTTWMKKNKFTVDETETGAPIVPQTWTEMWDLCKKIKDAHPTITPLGYDSDDNMFITLCEQYGIPYTSIDANGKGSIDFNNDQAKALITELKGYYDKGYFVTKGTLPNNSYTSTKFKEEQLIMSIGSTSHTSQYIPLLGGELAFDVDVREIPQANPDTPKVIAQGPSITFFKNDKITDEQVKASWKFYKHITNAYNSAVYAILTGFEPVNEAAYDSYIYQRYLNSTGEDADLFVDVANLTATSKFKKSYFFTKAFKGSSVARQQVGGIITNVMLDTKTVDTAFKEAEELAKFMSS